MDVLYGQLGFSQEINFNYIKKERIIIVIDLSAVKMIS